MWLLRLRPDVCLLQQRWVFSNFKWYTNSWLIYTSNKNWLPILTWPSDKILKNFDNKIHTKKDFRATFQVLYKVIAYEVWPSTILHPPGVEKPGARGRTRWWRLHSRCLCPFTHSTKALTKWGSTSARTSAVRWWSSLRTALPCTTGSVTTTSTPATWWTATGCSTNIPTTGGASTCWGPESTGDTTSGEPWALGSAQWGALYINCNNYSLLLIRGEGGGGGGSGKNKV